MNKKSHLRAAIAMALFLSTLFAPFVAFAEEALNANDLEAAQLTAATTFGAFTIHAKSDKNVTVEVIDVARTAADGEVFNVRIKLNGGGAVDYRSIQFTTKGKAQITIYLASSSKTDARILKVVDAAGAVVAELAAPPDDGTAAGIATLTIEKEGTYVVFSAGSGINIYQIVVK